MSGQLLRLEKLSVVCAGGPFTHDITHRQWGQQGALGQQWGCGACTEASGVPALGATRSQWEVDRGATGFPLHWWPSRRGGLFPVLLGPAPFGFRGRVRFLPPTEFPGAVVGAEHPGVVPGCLWETSTEIHPSVHGRLQELVL